MRFSQKLLKVNYSTIKSLLFSNSLHLYDSNLGLSNANSDYQQLDIFEVFYHIFPNYLN